MTKKHITNNLHKHIKDSMHYFDSFFSTQGAMLHVKPISFLELEEIIPLIFKKGKNRPINDLLKNVQKLKSNCVIVLNVLLRMILARQFPNQDIIVIAEYINDNDSAIRQIEEALQQDMLEIMPSDLMKAILVQISKRSMQQTFEIAKAFNTIHLKREGVEYCSALIKLLQNLDSDIDTICQYHYQGDDIEGINYILKSIQNLHPNSVEKFVIQFDEIRKTKTEIEHIDYKDFSLLIGKINESISGYIFHLKNYYNKKHWHLDASYNALERTININTEVIAILEDHNITMRKSAYFLCETIPLNYTSKLNPGNNLSLMKVINNLEEIKTEYVTFLEIHNDRLQYYLNQKPSGPKSKTGQGKNYPLTWFIKELATIFQGIGCVVNRSYDNGNLIKSPFSRFVTEIYKYTIPLVEQNIIDKDEKRLNRMIETVAKSLECRTK